MKKVLSFLLLFLLSIVIFARTIEVSEEQSGIWDADTVLVVDDVTVPKGMSLTIVEGAKVIFDGYFKIIVDGDLSAVGTEDEHIVFTVTDTTNFHDIHRFDGGWAGITFSECTGPIVLEYCDFSYGKMIEDPYFGGAVRFSNVEDVTIGHCRFTSNLTLFKGGALYAEYSNFNIYDCEVDGNLGIYDEAVSLYMYGGGMFFINCDVEMRDMYFHDNDCPNCYGGAVNFDSCSVVLDRALIENNHSTNAGGIGIQRSSHLNVVMSNAILRNNHVVHYGGGMACAISSPIINNFVVVNNTCWGGGGGGVQFFGEAYPVFNNCIFWGNRWESTGEKPGDTLYSSQICIWDLYSHPSFRYGIVEFGRENIYNEQFLQLYEEMSDEDPLFVDLANGDCHLQSSSPAINGGTPDTTGLQLPEFDFYGNPRILDDIIDIGVHEFYLYGDANEDGTVDVIDIISICSYIIGVTPEHFSIGKSDVNRDGVINILDIQAIITIIFSSK